MAAVTRIRMTYNNVYEVTTAGGRILVDTGPDYEGARAQLAAALDSRTPDIVIATHGHSDHAGLGAWWQSRNVPVAAGAADAHLTRHPHMVQVDEYDAMAQFVRTSGAPEDVTADAIAGLERRRAWALKLDQQPGYPPATSSTRWPTALRYEPFTPGRLLDADATILGVDAWQCPGHTPGNLVLVEPHEGWLFSGDQLLPDITPTPGVQFVPEEGGFRRFRSLPAFAASLQRLRNRDFTRCYPGHGDRFDDVAARVDANITAIEQRTERVAESLRQNGPATLYALCDRLYPRAVRRRFWQIVPTVQGHLDLLEAQHRATAHNGAFEAT